MPNQCVAANCTNKRADGFSLFQMPSDENLRAKWIQQIRRTRSGPNGKLWNPTKNSFLCCAHFTEDCFNPVSKLKQQFGIEMKQHKKFLLPGAVPSIFPRARGTESEASTAQPKKRRKSGAVEKRRRIELIRELLRPVAQKQTGQSREPVTRQTVKEEDDQEKNLCNSENNTTVSQLMCNTAAIHTKQEPFDELEKDFVNCCNRNAQLLNDVCGTVGTDAVKENEQPMDFDNCYNTSTPAQLSCSTAGIEVKKESGLEMTLGNYYNTVTSQPSCSTVVTSQPSCSTVVTSQPSCSTVVTSQPSCSTVVTSQPSCSTVVTTHLSSTSNSVVIPPVSSSTVVTTQLSSSTVDTSVKQEGEQKVDLNNCYTSTSPQLCCDTVSANNTQEYNSETNIGSSTCDKKSVDANLSELDGTTQLASNVSLALVQSFHIYCIPPNATEQPSKIPSDAIKKPAKSKWPAKSKQPAKYKKEECVPVQVDYVGTGHAASNTSQDSNGAAANPELILVPMVLYQPEESTRNKLQLPKPEQSSKQDGLKMDDGNSNINDSTSPQHKCQIVKHTDSEVENDLSNRNNIADAKEEDVLEDEDDFEVSEEELSSSEDEKKGHKSDSSWHMSSEEEQLFGDSDDSMSSCDSDRSEEIERQKKNERQRKLRKMKTSWVCKCGEKFPSNSLYYKHKLDAHPVPCQHCDEKFTSTLTLEKHLKTHMPSEDKLDLKGNKLFMCDHCGRFFTSKAMKRHEIQISDARPYKCEVENCKSTFKTKAALRHHVSEVHEKDRFPCPYEGCKKTFGVKAKMLVHYKVHTDERSYQCSYCGKMFQRTDHLRVHMRIHTGDTPFNCTLCNYSGRQSNSLRSHMKVHHPEHCKKKRFGDKKGAKLGKKPRKKAMLEKDGLADKAPGSAKKTAPYSTRSLHDRKGAKPGKKPRKKAVIEEDSSADKAPGSAKKTARQSRSHRAK